MREFQVLGEAARLVTETTRQQHATVPWRLIAGIRNRLIHKYFDVRLDVVWETIQRDVPLLIAQLEALVPPEKASMIRRGVLQAGPCPPGTRH